MSLLTEKAKLLKSPQRINKRILTYVRMLAEGACWQKMEIANLTDDCCVSDLRT